MKQDILTELDEVELIYIPSSSTSSEFLMAIVQNWDWTNRIPENREFVVFVIIKLIGRPGRLDTPFVKSYLEGEESRIQD